MDSGGNDGRSADIVFDCEQRVSSLLEYSILSVEDVIRSTRRFIMVVIMKTK